MQPQGISFSIAIKAPWHFGAHKSDLWVSQREAQPSPLSWGGSRFCFRWGYSITTAAGNSAGSC